MEKIRHLLSQEIVFASADDIISRAISQAVKSKKLRKLAPRLYSNNLKDKPEATVKRNLYLILGHLYPGAVISHRSALEGGPKKDTIFLTYKYTKKQSLPGITIRLLEGKGAQADDAQFMKGLFFASQARALLENMQASRGEIPKSISQKEIEQHLDKIASLRGIEELNSLRDQAKKVSKSLSMQAEFKKLDKLIGALLGTQKTKLQSQSAIARAKGLPYDAHRLNLFSNLCAGLKKTVLPILKAKLKTKDSLQNLAFFESYFSNYIEGTEFEINEAEKIIFDNKIIRGRAADSHDILSTFRLASNSSEMNKTPKTAKGLVSVLKNRHHALMSFRSEIDPGNFKQVSNRAGNTVFVAPDLVDGTLHEAFTLYNSLDEGLARAIFMMFIVSEVHPFNDGNGRLARIMMNAELSHAGETRIIIPTVYREDYLLTLRRFSQQHDSAPYIKMLLRAQAFVASINFNDYDKILLQLKKANAFCEPFDGKLNFK